MMQNINYHDFLNMCRTCMLDIDLKPIEDKTIIEILEIITDRNYKTSDELPQQICGTCIKKLLEINNFIKQTRTSEENFKICLTNFKNECASATIDAGDKPVEIYVIEPPKIKEETPDVVKAEKTATAINFDSLINDMRKEFDVAPIVDADPLKITKATSNAPDVENISLKPSKSLEIKQLECEVCSKTVEMGQLVRRKRTHTYACEVCNKVVNTSSDLVKSKRIHSEFRTSSRLTTHSDKCDFKCNVCCKSYKSANLLSKHMKTHGNDKNNECEICNKNFASYSGLVKHKKTQH